VSIEPRLQLGAIHLSRSDSEYRLLGVIHRRLDPAPVESQKRRHRGMPHTLVPVDKRMILNQGEPEHRRSS
jgi:hypothetical protein